jgi:hypothetical protein
MALSKVSSVSMWCDAHFAAFNQRLMLDNTRMGRIGSELRHFTDFCSGDAEMSVALGGEPFLQGSVATRTAIRPLSSDEYDVDVVYPFRLSAFPVEHQYPRSIVAWFIGRLQNDGFYVNRLTPKDRCARIDYAGDFHVDIIPSTQEVLRHQPYAVPTRDQREWTINNPLLFGTASD